MKKLFTNDWVWSPSDDKRGYDLLKFFGVVWWLFIAGGLLIYVKVLQAFSVTTNFDLPITTCLKFYLCPLVFLLPGIFGAFCIFRKG